MKPFEPILVEFVGGPLCGQQWCLPDNSSRYTCMESTQAGYVVDAKPEQFVRHVYLRRETPLANGNYPMDWVPPKPTT